MILIAPVPGHCILDTSVCFNANVIDMCIPFVLVTPGHLMFSKFSRTVPYRVKETWILFVSVFVSCIILHLTGRNIMPHFPAQMPKRSMSL